MSADALRADVEALAAMTRGSASPGERASGEWIAERLRAAGAADVRLEPFRYQSSYAWAHGLHLAAGLAGARSGGLGGSLLAGAALASLELEVSGRHQWVRRLLPTSEATNVVAGIPAAVQARRTIVLVAHHDAARTGVGWHPRLVRMGARPGVMPPRMGLVGAGFLAAATPGLRRLGAAVLAVSLAAYVDNVASPTVPGANDNATGVAALLALARRLAAEPLPHTETVLVATGCEESGMGGMSAFLRGAGARLDPARTLVLSLDTLGSGTPVVAAAEATLLAHSYREEDLALAEEGAARAGLDAPQRWRVGAWTDAILARFAGLPALSLLSVGPDCVYPNWHRITDTPDRLDWECLDRCTRIAAGIAEVFDA